MTPAPSADPTLTRRRGRPRKRPPPSRKRGGQPGNKNRWRHGRYSGAARRARAALAAEIAQIEGHIADILGTPLQ